MQIEKFNDGIVICGDSCVEETIQAIKDELGNDVLVPLIIADPPYGNIVNKDWDKTKKTDVQFAEWMVAWTKLWNTLLIPRGAFYIWGGIGKPGFRPFLKFIPEIEEIGKFELANLITWNKKRAYGVSTNYLFTREELAYFIKGEFRKPYIFNKPYLNNLRGYDGFNKKYSPKSPYLRRTNVWSDVTEIFNGKIHECQKPKRLHEIIIETHTNEGDWVIDPFAGAGTTAFAARKLNRKFIIVEKDEKEFVKIIDRLSGKLNDSYDLKAH